MPVIFEKQIDTAKKLAVWHITESDAELFALSTIAINATYTAKRNRELAVSALLLNHLLGYNAHLNLTKDKFGKPYLDNSAIAVSFSHSQQMVACIADSTGAPVGIDIEKEREKIKLIADKFCTEADSTVFKDMMHYHLIWGGKEVLYKIYAKKELDFREHLSVNFNSNSGLGHVHKQAYHTTHNLEFAVIMDYVLVWGY